MKSIYIHLCHLNKIRQDFILDFYRALCGNKRATLPKNIYHPTEPLKLSEEGEALIHKVYSMVYGGDMNTVLRMLYSFRFGAKRLNTCQSWSTHEGQYEYTDKDGNEKLSHKGNLPNGHFRWNYGRRYTLSDLELKRIEDFLGAVFPPDFNYNTRKHENSRTIRSKAKL